MRYYLVLFSPLWSYSVHIVSIQSILTTSIQFGPLIWSILSILALFKPFSLFGPLSSYSVNFSPILSTSIHSVQFNPILSILVYFGLFWSPILIYFGPFLCTYIMAKDRFELREPILNPKL